MNTRYVLLLLLAGCHGGAAAHGGTGDRLAIDRLYPLRAGSVWTYDVETGDGPPTLAITRVTARKESEVEVSSGGAPIRYALRDGGLYRPDRGTFLLKPPIRKGASWDAGHGATSEVTDVDKRVATPAGEFSGCVEVRESGGDTPKIVRTVFCPDVGPVELESSMGLAVTGATARVLARLRGYDFSGALQTP